MIIDVNRYQSVTLKSGRQQSFIEDLILGQEIYTKLGSSRHKLGIKQFNDLIWCPSQLQFLPNCISQQENEDQYFQLLYSIIIKKYGMNHDKFMKVFAIFLLYFTHFSSPKSKSICVGPDYVDNLTEFLLENKKQKNLDYYRVAQRLSKTFCFTIKQGIKNVLIIPSSQEKKQKFKKPRQLQKSKYMKQITQTIPYIQQAWNFYQELKNQQRQLTIFHVFNLNQTDKFLIHRINNLFNNYERQLSRNINR